VASFNQPFGLAADQNGNLYAAEFGGRRLRKVTPTNGYFPVGVPDGSAPSEKVRLSNADGVTPNEARPFILYPQALAPGATSAERKWDFIVPAGVSAFDFTVTVEADTDTLAPPPAADGTGSPDVWVRTFAGAATSGFANGPAGQARFSGAGRLAVSASGVIYVADIFNYAIRRIGTDGKVTTLAGGNGGGSTDGPGSSARFYNPDGIAATADGNTLFVADQSNNRIRRIVLTGDDPASSDSWTVSTIAGTGANGSLNGNGGAAQFYRPTGIVCDPDGANLFVTENNGNRVRRVFLRNGGNPTAAASWEVKLVAGDDTTAAGATGTADGIGPNARFTNPRGITMDTAGNLYIADFGNHLIRKIVRPTDNSASVVSTLSGSTSGYQDGQNVSAMFNYPAGVAVDSAGYLYVTDTYNHRIRRVSPGGIVSTVAGVGTFGGEDGPGNIARFAFPANIAVDASGNIYVTESDNSNESRIRLIQRVMK
jgi:sugar lactone lactonase YvrE